MGKNHFFGRIDCGKMRLSPIGKIIRNFWICTSRHFRNIHLDEFIIMPNHFHGILAIKPAIIKKPNAILLPTGNPMQNFQRLNAPIKRKSLPKPRNTMIVKTSRINKFKNNPPDSLHHIICSFKSASKSWCDKFGYKLFSWQPRYSGLIIPTEANLNDLRGHIITNPSRWELDKHNPINFNRISDEFID
jgi:putative transposase